MLKTNKNRLVMIAVAGDIQPVTSGGRYSVTFDGEPSIRGGGAGVKLNFRCGDPAYGWVADHFEAGACVVNTGPATQFEALNAFACIGNEARLVTGEAKGAKGRVTGKHGHSKTFVDFPWEVLEKATIGDRVQVTGWGCGMELIEHPKTRVMSLGPQLLEAMKIREEAGKLVVPVVKIIEGRVMGSGIAGGSGNIPDLGDFDIQSTCPSITKRYGYGDIRIGDIIGIKDTLSHWSRCIHPGAVTVGIVTHGASESSGHGPGVSPIISGYPGSIVLIEDAEANVACRLRLRPDLGWG